jgi:hypothetical protein
MTFIKEWIGKEWVGSKSQEELKIYPCMDIDSCQNCLSQPLWTKAQAMPPPICERKLKPRLEIGKIIS